MALPRRGDPRRPLRLAVRSCRVLGALLMLFAACMLVPLFLSAGGRTSIDLGPLFALAFYGAIGAAYLVFAHFVNRKQMWAVIAAIELNSLGLLLTGLGAAAMIVMLAAGTFNNASTNTGPAKGILWGSAAFELLIALALGQVVYWLARSFPALRLSAVEEDRGFDVLPIAAVPIAPVTTLPKVIDGDATA